MQVTELKSEGLRKSFKVVVEAARINTQLEAELKSAGQRVKIPGFRPGHIPMKVLQQRYGKSVQNDVLQRSINQAASEIMAERNLRPATTPQFTLDEYKDGGDLSFTLTCDIFPDMPEIDYSKITLERETFEIDEKRIDDMAKDIASRSPKLNRAEGGKAKDGNVVAIDFKGSIDGKLFDGGSASDFRLDLGSGQFIAGFEEQLVGAKEGEERVVKVTFPENYQAKNLAGKAAEFAVTVKEIYSKETPAIDDEFAKARGFENVAGLRDAIRGQMTSEYTQLVRSHLKKQLFDIIEEQYDFPLPQGMVEMELRSIMERLKQAQAEGDESMAGKSDEELQEEYRHIAERRVKLGLMLAEIGNRNKLQITREEMMQAVFQQARMFPGQEQKVLEFYQKNPERADDLRGPILEEKAVDFIIGKVKMNDRKVAIDDLLTADEEDEVSPKNKPKAKKAPAKKKAE